MYIMKEIALFQKKTCKLREGRDYVCFSHNGIFGSE